MENIMLEKMTELIKLNEAKLKQMPTGVNRTKQAYRTRQLRNALVALKQLKSAGIKIKSGRDAMVQSKKRGITGIGSGTSKRIDEIFKTQNLAELAELQQYAAKDDLITILNSIHGIGLVGAKKLSTEVKNIKELKQKVDEGKIKVTHAVEIGLKYYEDFKERIPREHIVEFYTKLNRSIKKVNPDYHVVIAGSYRRNTADSGDIDVLFTIKDDNGENHLQNVISQLIKDGLLVDHLTEEGSDKYNGVTKIRNKYRRIDIKYTPYSSYYYALLYFTGSANNNRRMRQVAKNNGYTLNEHGLSKIGSKKNLFKVESEAEIYKILNLPYQNPENR